jgi:hypothetical protein
MFRKKQFEGWNCLQLRTQICKWWRFYGYGLRPGNLL